MAMIAVENSQSCAVQSTPIDLSFLASLGQQPITGDTRYSNIDAEMCQRVETANDTTWSLSMLREYSGDDDYGYVSITNCMANETGLVSPYWMDTTTAKVMCGWLQLETRWARWFSLAAGNYPAKWKLERPEDEIIRVVLSCSGDETSPDQCETMGWNTIHSMEDSHQAVVLYCPESQPEGQSIDQDAPPTLGTADVSTSCGQNKYWNGEQSGGGGVGIVGGVEALPHEFPWQVWIEAKGNFACGGSIINSEYVLTAAHCISEFSSSILTVHIGNHNSSGGGGPGAVVANVAQIKINPDWDKDKLIGDVALLKLNSYSI